MKIAVHAMEQEPVVKVLGKNCIITRIRVLTHLENDNDMKFPGVLLRYNGSDLQAIWEEVRKFQGKKYEVTLECKSRSHQMYFLRKMTLDQYLAVVPVLKEDLIWY